APKKTTPPAPDCTARPGKEEIMFEKRKRKYNYRRKGSRRIAVIITIAVLAAAVLAVAGIAFYRYTHPLNLRSTIVEHELMKPFDPWENVKDVYFGKKDDVKIQSETNVEQIGDYPVIYTYRGHKYDVTVRVRDTTPPALKVHPYTTDLTEDIKPEYFVEQADDATEVTLRFKDEKIPDTEGTFDVTVIAEDSSGNRTEETAVLTRVKDTTAPVLEGIGDVEVLQGQTCDFSQNVTVKDDLDPAPQFSVDSEQVDFTVPGTYEVTYTVRDRSGNEDTIVRKVTVKADPDYERKIVYLTFDDGPSDNTEKVLDILKEYNVKGTFFVTGNNQKKNGVLKRIIQEGSAIGLHTYTHDYAKVYASEDAYFSDLQKMSDMVKEVTGTESHIIRFPGGSSNVVSAKYTPGLMTVLTKKVQEKGYQYFDWNCDSTDASGNNVPVETLIKNATSSNAKHINILMHDTDAKDTTVEALPKIIEYYRDKGYAFEPLTTDSPAVHHKVNN
ncbi:MAG TPA: polysaccharide deacetylase family protein, partial [Candidatus Mediterraneibacter colneyensis]|nr:polysaccharide deacetylase family protein [Candidatus Mediterraneibacter colneyensis]